MTADGIVNSSDNAWADTWKGAWTPLPSAAAAASGTPLPPPPNGLSGGAIAGIVIGVLLGVALVAAGAAILFLRRRRRRQGANGLGIGDPMTAAPYMDHSPKMMSPVSEAERPEFKGELGGDGLHEMGGDGEEGRSELGDRDGDEGGGVGELEGTSTAGSPRMDVDEGGFAQGGAGEAIREGGKGGETEVSPRLDVDLEDTGGDFAEGLMSRRSSRRVSAL